MNDIKRGAVFGLIAFILLGINNIVLSYRAIVSYTTGVVYDTLTSSNLILSIILLIGNVGILFFYFGFLKLSEKYKNKILRITSLIFIIFSALYLILSIISTTSTAIDLVRAEEVDPAVNLYLVLFILIFLIILTIFYSVLTILFGIGIKRLGKGVKYSKVTGILYIISGATMIIFIGFILTLVANLFAVVLLWKESNKHTKHNREEKKKK